MALYWPDEKVALDIVDDPYRRPFNGDESYTVLRVTSSDLCNYDSYRRVMKRLCELLGKETPNMPGWEEKHHLLHDLLFDELPNNHTDCNYPLPDFVDPPFDTNDLSDIEIIASSDEEAEFMRMVAHGDGKHVRGVSVWEGPVPPGSFEVISDTMRMSTPEYFFLRKANQLAFPEAVCMGMELCGKYRTILTQHNKEDDYDFLKRPRTSKDAIRHYLRDIRETKEGKRAKRVLRYVMDECNSPMSCYLYILLCLPSNRGSYAFERALPSAAFRLEDGFMPDSSGDFLAYDLCWPKKLVALQYTGSDLVTERNYNALATEGMRVVCVSDNDIADPEEFDHLARKLAGLLEAEVPKPTKGWLAARDKLRKQIPIPSYDKMMLTFKSIDAHKNW